MSSEWNDLRDTLSLLVLSFLGALTTAEHTSDHFMNKIRNNEFEGTSETQEERDELYVAGYFPMLDSFHNDKKNIATCAN